MVKIAILGSGLMGIKIAGELAYHGHRVKLYDVNLTSLDSAHQRIEEDKRQLHIDGLLPHRNFIGQILCISSLEETVKDAEFIFEAVLEDLSLKQDLLDRVSRCCLPTAIIGTNTLRLDVALIADRVVARERTMGLRFLYPVYCIPEVEITPCRYTSAVYIDKVRSLLERMGKTLFFRSGDEPLILSEEQREQRKQMRLDQIKNSSSVGWHLESSLPMLSHRGNACPVQDSDLYSVSDSEKDCAICMDRKRDCLLCPCHHMVTCSECARALLRRRDSCPICRKEITEIIHVYHS